MKSKILLLVFVFATLFSMAQNGIGFQGIARDAQGIALSSKSVVVKFTIGSFTESQTLLTDNFGVFSASIGSVNSVGFGNLVFANISENLKVEVNGVTIYDDKFNCTPYAKAAENGVPVGSIMPWAGSVSTGSVLDEPIPGWIVCNGAALTADTKYTKLKQVLGTSWGTNRVPDLRGTFLRGVNNGRSDVYKDVDAATRVAVNSGNTGDNTGSFQADEIQSHKHTGSTSSDGAHTHKVDYPFSSSEVGDGAVSIMGDDQNNGSWKAYDILTTDGAHVHTISIANTGGSDTRPVNAAVVYIIKY